MYDYIFLGRLGHVIFVRDCPFVVVLNALRRPLGPPYAFTCVSFALFPLFRIPWCYFPCLQGGRAFASKVAHLRDPELRKLAGSLHLRAAKAKARSTMERYSRASQKFRKWSSCFAEVGYHLMRCQLPFTWSFCYSRVTPTPHLSQPVMALTGHTIRMAFQVLVIQNW